MARKGNRGEMYKDLFSGVSITTVSIPLLAEELKQAKELTQANKWSEEEGLQIIFANGLSYLLGEARLTALNGSDVVLAEELKKVTDALMDMQSKYAVMKFRAYTLDEAKQGLQMNVTGLELENRMSASRLWKYHEDEELLKKEMKQIRLENQRLMKELALLRGEVAPEPDRRGVLRRLRDALFRSGG